MNLEKVRLPKDIEDILDVLYSKALIHNPELNESVFMECIISEWLEPYLRDRSQSSMQRKNVVLKNDLENAIKHSGKTQKQVAQKTGLNTTYLNRVIKGKYEPSVTVALLLMDSISYPSSKINELFYLEPVYEE